MVTTNHFLSLDATLEEANAISVYNASIHLNYILLWHFAAWFWVNYAWMQAMPGSLCVNMCLDPCRSGMGRVNNVRFWQRPSYVLIWLCLCDQRDAYNFLWIMHRPTWLNYACMWNGLPSKLLFRMSWDYSYKSCKYLEVCWKKYTSVSTSQTLLKVDLWHAHNGSRCLSSDLDQALQEPFLVIYNR